MAGTIVKMDHKYQGMIYKAKDNTEVSPDEWIVFRAKDNALPLTLEFYLQRCKDMGASEDHIKGIKELIERVYKWRGDNPDKCKTPDTLEGELVNPGRS